MSKNLIQDMFTAPKKRTANKLGVVQYLERIGGMDAYFFETNEEADTFGKAVRKNIEEAGTRDVEIEISYKVVRLKLKRTED